MRKIFFKFCVFLRKSKLYQNKPTLLTQFSATVLPKPSSCTNSSQNAIMAIRWEYISISKFCSKYNYISFLKYLYCISISTALALVCISSFLLSHTISSQDFCSFRFLSFFLSKIVQLKFFCEIKRYTSRLLSFDKFFPTWPWLLIYLL